MFNFKKYYKLVFFILILVFLFYERFYIFKPNLNVRYSNNLDRTNLSDVISDYIINNYQICKECEKTNSKRFESHKIYEIKKRYGVNYVYMYDLYTYIKKENGIYKMGSGGANPLILIVYKNNKNTYSVLGHKNFETLDEYPINLPPKERNIFEKINTTKLLNELNNDIYFKIENKLHIKRDDIKID